MDRESKYSVFVNASPVVRIPTDPEEDELLDGIGLCLSGGGYRAMLFHTGAVWRLYETGWLRKVRRISSVSGGSITSAVLAMNWEHLDVDGGASRQKFVENVVYPIRRLAGVTVDIRALLKGLLLPGPIPSQLVGEFRRRVFGERTLQDLPDEPRFIFDATNVQTGNLWRFSKKDAQDWRVGKVASPNTELATVVASSAAFPPFFSPLVVKFLESDYEEPEGRHDLHRPPFTTRVVLTDGGVIDNLGLETVWKKYGTVLVSDAAGGVADEAKPKTGWLRHFARVIDFLSDQESRLRKRQVIGSFVGGKRRGAYWGIRTSIANYELSNALPCPHSSTMKLAEEPTRLARLDAGLQERLVNWGYAVCDAALRKHIDGDLPPPKGFPYPDAEIG